MGRINAEISAIIERFQGQELDAHYLAFFECFNQGLFFEAHEVLEKIWLPQRKERNGLFYKGLIQLAGAFVHLQKDRVRPAGALLKLARANLERYRPIHERLDVNSVLELIDVWSDQLDRGKFVENPLKSRRPSPIKLIGPL
jgi:predicted metal-dependent hydrolase